MTVKIALSKTSKKNSGRFTAIVSSEDSDLAEMAWTAKVPRSSRVGSQVYAVKEISGRERFLHHLVAERSLGPQPYESVVDHMNRDGLDNRRENLRYISHKKNCLNRNKNRNNTSGMIGVSRCSNTGHWVARINVDGKRLQSRFREYDAAVSQRLAWQSIYIKGNI